MTFRGVMLEAMRDVLIRTSFPKIARRLNIDDSDQELTPEQAKRLQAYLAQRVMRWHWALVREINK